MHMETHQLWWVARGGPGVCVCLAVTTNMAVTPHRSIWNTISHCLYSVSVFISLCTWKHSAKGYVNTTVEVTTRFNARLQHNVCVCGRYNTVLHIQHTSRIACVACLFSYLYRSPQWLWRPGAALGSEVGTSTNVTSFRSHFYSWKSRLPETDHFSLYMSLFYCICIVICRTRTTWVFLWDYQKENLFLFICRYIPVFM